MWSTSKRKHMYFPAAIPISFTQTYVHIYIKPYKSTPKSWTFYFPIFNCIMRYYTHNTGRWNKFEWSTPKLHLKKFSSAHLHIHSYLCILYFIIIIQVYIYILLYIYIYVFDTKNGSALGLCSSAAAKRRRHRQLPTSTKAFATDVIYATSHCTLRR